MQMGPSFKTAIQIFPAYMAIIVTLTVAGAGAGGIKWLRTGEQPRRKDRWEGLMLLLPEIRAGAPSFIARDDPDAAWMQQHEQLGNEVGPASDSGAVAAARTTLGDGRQ